MTTIALSIVAIIIIVLIIDTQKGVLLAIIIRPINDCFWDSQHIIFGIKPTELFGAVFPSVVFIKLLLDRNHSFLRTPHDRLWSVYMYFNLFNTVLVASIGSGLMHALSFLFRVMNGFVGFFLFKSLFSTKSDFKKLLIAMLVAGLFPLGMSLYQNFLGGAMRVESTTGGLVRNIGLYHDAYTLRLYAFQTLTAVILFWCYFTERGGLIVKSILIPLGLCCVLAVYKIYSKAGYMVLAEWSLIWTVFRRNYLILAGIICVAILLPLLGIVKIPDEIETVYSKEIAGIQGAGKIEKTFAGRWYGWQQSISKWMDAPLYMKIVGDGDTQTGVHNDFMRALLSTGIIGFGLYLSIVFGCMIRAVLNTIQKRSPLNIMATMLIFMWVVDAIGLVPSAYPGYQIYVWGFVGLAFGGVKGLDEAAEPTDRAAEARTLGYAKV